VAYTKAVLIIGGSGFVGTHLALKLRENYRVYATYSTRPMTIPGVTFIPARAENSQWIRTLIYSFRPEYVIYAAGSPSLEFARKEPKIAEAVHTGGPVVVADAIGSVGSKFIFLSSCYTFDGSKGNYREAETLIPESALGKVKVGGENFVRSKSSNHVIIRSVPLIGRGNGHRPTFLDEWRIKLDRGEPLMLLSNELHSFTTVKALTDMIVRILESGARNTVFHFGGLDKLSWFSLGRLFAERFGYSPELIQSTVDGPEVDYSLNSTRAVQQLKIKPLLLKESFDLID